MADTEISLKVLPLSAGVLNFQKCYLPMKYFDKIGAHFNKYAFLKVATECCVVQIYFSANLHEQYCFVDASVYSGACGSSRSLPRRGLSTSSIISLNGPFEAKSVNISLVFVDLEKLIAWKKRVNSLQVLVGVLKLCALSCGKKIFLGGLEEYVDLGIVYVMVNDVAVRGKTKIVDHTVFKLEHNAVVMVDDERTVQMVKSKTSPDVGGMERPYKLLLDIVNDRKTYKESFVKCNVLLIGPSGCGKKTLVTKVANSCDALFVEINGAEILSPKAGQGRPGEVEENIRTNFELIKSFCEHLSTNRGSGGLSRVQRNSAGCNHSKHTSASHPVIILLLSHIELMCPNRERGIGKGVVGQTTQFLGAIDSLQHLNNIVIFATSSSVDDVDQAVRRPGRLDKEVFLGIPDEDERVKILEKLILNSGVYEGGSIGEGDPSTVSSIARRAAILTPGRVPADLCLLCQQVEWMCLQRNRSTNPHPGDRASSWLNDFACCASKLPVSSLIGGPGTLVSEGNQSCTLESRPSLLSIGGLEEVKKRLITSVRDPLLHPEAFKRLGIRPPRGVLLYGPPGCAKTTLARALAMPSTPADGHSGGHSITLLSSSAAELYSPFVGDSERKVMDLFERARTGAPSVVFIDELDALFGSRDGMHKGGVQERVLAALLMEMDGVGHRLIAPKVSLASETGGDQVMADEMQEEEHVPHVLGNGREGLSLETFSQVTVIAATNRPDLIDEALLRPGRLDQLIYVPPPNEDGRLEILSFYTAKMPLEGHDKDLLLRDLARKTELYSGADLRNLCKEAALLAISEEGFDVMEVKGRYFEKALKSMRPSLTFDMVVSYEKFCENKCL